MQQGWAKRVASMLTPRALKCSEAQTSHSEASRPFLVILPCH